MVGFTDIYKQSTVFNTLIGLQSDNLNAITHTQIYHNGIEHD
jgi:hypothetical protein